MEFTLDRPVEEGVDPLVDLLDQSADGNLVDARRTHGLYEIIDPARRDGTRPALA